MKKLFALIALAACGQSTTGSPMLEPKPAGLESDPKWLTYTCVEPGCDTTLTANVSAIGDRDIAVKRIVLVRPAV